VIFVRFRSLIVASSVLFFDFMRVRLFWVMPLLVIAPALSLVACSDNQAETPVPPVPWVRTQALAGDQSPTRQAFSGTVRARTEIPVAFQVPGRISQRLVDAGQSVTQGKLLFTLDARELEQNLASADAARVAALAELEVAKADLVRHRHLIAQNTVSQQAFERVELGERSALARLQVADAQLQQARIALGHAELRAKSSGVLLDVTGEPGQVVNTGLAIATLADASQLEVEVFLPDGLPPPQSAELYAANGDPMPLRLREVAGAADAASRTWRVRYRVEQASAHLKLGSVVKVSLTQQDAAASYRVPVAALDERGDGAQIWRVKAGRVEPVAVEVLALEHEYARIVTALEPGTHIVVLGTHLLTPGLQVQEKKP
jgi:RND family efflux transporter MFP subunit